MNKKLRDMMHDRYFRLSGLIRRLSIEQAEALFAVQIDGDESELLAFGHLNPEWKKLLGKILPGDEIWEFSTVRPRGDTIRGVKLIRNSAVIDAIVAQHGEDP